MSSRLNLFRIAFLIIVFAMYFAFGAFNIYEYKIINIILLFYVFFEVIRTIKEEGRLFNLYTIFVGVFTVFILARPLLDLFNYFDLTKTFFFTSYKFSERTLTIISFNIIVSLVGISFGYALKSKRRIKIYLPKSEIAYNPRLKIYYNVLLLLFLIIGYFVIFSTIITLKNKGYLSIYSNDSLGYLTKFKLLVLILYVNILYLQINYVKNKSHLIFVFMFFFFTLISSGQRGPAFTYLLAFLYLYNKLHIIKFTFLKILSSVFVIISLSFLIGFFRYNSELQLVKNPLLTFFIGQGISYQVIGYAVDYSNLINYTFLDIFDGLSKFFNDIYSNLIAEEFYSSQAEINRQFKIYSLYISSVVNYDLFKEGYGIGGSYIAQLYSTVGIYGQFVGGVIIGSMLRILSKIYYKSYFYIIGYLPLLSNIFYLPRDNIFDFVTELTSLYILTSPFFIIFIILDKK